MKLSTKLLLAVLTMAVFALVGTNLVLKAEYDKINFADPFWNYRRVPLQPFRHLHVTSTMLQLVEVRQGTGPEPVVYVSKAWADSLQIGQHRDSLRLGYVVGERERFSNGYDEADEPKKASVVVFLPRLASLTADRRAWVRLNGLRSDSLTVQVGGPSLVAVRSSRLGVLNLTLRDSAAVWIPAQNQVRTLRFDGADQAGLKLNADAVQQFRPVIRDGRVEVRLTGKALTQFVKAE